MILIFKTKYNNISIEVPYEDLTVGEVVEQLFRPGMLALGYHAESLKNTIGEVDDDMISRINEDEPNTF